MPVDPFSCVEWNPDARSRGPHAEFIDPGQNLGSPRFVATAGGEGDVIESGDVLRELLDELQNEPVDCAVWQGDVLVAVVHRGRVTVFEEPALEPLLARRKGE